MGLMDVLRREFSFFTGNYRVLVVSWILIDLAMEMPTPNFQYYVEALEGTGVAVGIIGLASFLAMAVVAFPGGYLADRYGRRWLITTMTFGMALSTLLFALAPTWHFILLGSIVSNLFLIYQPALFAMFQDSLPPERRGIGSSITELIRGTVNTPGPAFAGFLFLQFGLVPSMRIIYLIMTTLYLTAAVWRLRLKETVMKAEPIRFRYFISSYPKALKESVNVWKAVPRSMFWLFISQTLIMFGWSLTQVINAFYARDVLLIPEEQWWVVFIPLFLTMIIASIPIGKMIDKIGRKIPLILGLCVFSVAILIFVTANLARARLFTVMISMCLFGIAQLLVMAALTAFLTDLVRPENRGKVNGFINFIGYIAMGIGMLLGSYFYVSFVPQSPFYVTLGLIVITLLITLFRVHEPKKKVGSA
jgi:MFS family permease